MIPEHAMPTIPLTKGELADLAASGGRRKVNLSRSHRNGVPYQAARVSRASGHRRPTRVES